MKPESNSDENRVVRPFLRRIVPSLVILLAVAGSGDSSGSGPTTSTGAQVTKSVPFVRESIGEIRALGPFREQTVPENRAIPFLRIPRRSDATGEAGFPLAGPTLSAPSLPSSPAPLAPALDSSFAGLGNPPHSQGDVIPPDTMGAAGPNHLVSILNSDFGVFNKTGTLLQKVPLQSFWASLGTAAGEPADFPFDPKILYDQYSGRFFAVTLGGKNAPDSWVMIAVSPPSDPTGAWDKWAIDADLDNGIQTSNSADYPGLGVDPFNIYITANMFNSTPNGQYGKVWVIPKPQLLTNPGATITWFEFHGAFLSGFSRQAAHSFGAAAAEYLVSEGAAAQLLLTRIDNVSGIPVLHSPVPVEVAAYTSMTSTPGAPQLGNDNTVDTSDTRVLNVVYRNGSVWATHHVVGPSGKVEVAWYRINPGTGAVEAQGRVNDPVRWYYYPSIAVNQDNVAAIGFSGSSPVEFVGGYYTIVRPSGIADAVSQLKAGEAPYYKTFTSTSNRWGDFSATVVDPGDDTSFWTLQEYAMPHEIFTDNNSNIVDRSRWGTWWGKFHPTDVPSPTGLTATADNASQVTLRWTDIATNETGYVVERKVGAAGIFGVLTSPHSLPPDSVTYTDSVGLVAGTKYYYRVGAVGSNGTSYSIEVPVTTPGSPSSSSGGGGGGGCVLTRSGGEVSYGASLLSVGILLLPAFALGLRRFLLRRERTASIRPPLC